MPESLIIVIRLTVAMILRAMINLKKELKESSLPFLIMRYNVDGPNMSLSETVNIAPREGHIPVSVTSGPNWEALVFPKDYSTARNHSNEEREVEFG